MAKSNTVKKSAPVKSAPRAKTLDDVARRHSARAQAQREAEKAKAEHKAKQAARARKSYLKRKAAKEAERAAAVAATAKQTPVVSKPARPVPQQSLRAVGTTVAVGSQLELPGISKAQLVTTLEVLSTVAKANGRESADISTTIALAKLLRD